MVTSLVMCIPNTPGTAFASIADIDAGDKAATITVEGRGVAITIATAPAAEQLAPRASTLARFRFRTCGHRHTASPAEHGLAQQAFLLDPDAGCGRIDLTRQLIEGARQLCSRQGIGIE